MDFDDICLNLDDKDDTPSYSSSKSQSHNKSLFQSKSNNKRDDYKSSNKAYNNNKETNVKSNGANHNMIHEDTKVKPSSSNIDNDNAASEQQIKSKNGNSNNKSSENNLPSTTSSSINQVKIKRPLWQESEDPNRYHANPTYLSKDALLKPHNTVISNLIFSRIEFKSLSIDPKLVSVLTEPTSSGGLQLKTSTRIQSVTIPLLSGLNNVLMKSQTGSGKPLLSYSIQSYVFTTIIITIRVTIIQGRPSRICCL